VRLKYNVGYSAKQMRRVLARTLCLLSIAILPMLIGGCAMVIFECPPLKKYSKEFQAKAADESKGPATQQLVSDYGQHRDACRAMGSREWKLPTLSSR